MTFKRNASTVTTFALCFLSSQAVAQSSNTTSLTSISATPPAASLKVGTPPDGKGQVVFFREPALQGFALWFKVRENGAELGKLGQGRYFVQAAEPGVHTYTLATETTDTLRLDIEAGETYYVETAFSRGLLLPRPDMRPSTSTEFEKVASELKLAEPPAPAVSPASPAASSN
jgi:hypothetical protein